jgi:hypothetical protein
VLGFVLNDGTPLRSAEVKVDNGPWQRATLDRARSRLVVCTSVAAQQTGLTDAQIKSAEASLYLVLFRKP